MVRPKLRCDAVKEVIPSLERCRSCKEDGDSGDCSCRATHCLHSCLFSLEDEDEGNNYLKRRISNHCEWCKELGKTSFTLREEIKDARTGAVVRRMLFPACPDAARILQEEVLPRAACKNPALAEVKAFPHGKLPPKKVFSKMPGDANEFAESGAYTSSDEEDSDDARCDEEEDADVEASSLARSRARKRKSPEVITVSSSSEDELDILPIAKKARRQQPEPEREKDARSRAAGSPVPGGSKGATERDKKQVREAARKAQAASRKAGGESSPFAGKARAPPRGEKEKKTAKKCVRFQLPPDTSDSDESSSAGEEEKAASLPRKKKQKKSVTVCQPGCPARDAMAEVTAKIADICKEELEPVHLECDCESKTAGEDHGYDIIAAAESVKDINAIIECRMARFLQRPAKGTTHIVHYTTEAGLATAAGCPEQSPTPFCFSKDDDFLAVVKQRNGHHCSSAFTVVMMILPEFLTPDEEKALYATLSGAVPVMMEMARPKPRGVVRPKEVLCECLFGEDAIALERKNCTTGEWEKGKEAYAARALVEGGASATLGCTYSRGRCR